MDPEDRLSRANAPRLHLLKRDLAVARQGNLSVAAYYAKMKGLWDELSACLTVPVCSCGAVEKLIAEREEEQVHQFVMGLSDRFGVVRSQILSSRPLPALSKAYAMVLRVEKQLAISSRVAMNAVDYYVTEYYRQQLSQGLNRSHRDHCKRPVLTKDRYFEASGYPPGWHERSCTYGSGSAHNFAGEITSSAPRIGWILSPKALLSLATILFVAMVMRMSVPVIADLVYEVPSAYGFMLSWLQPPYLYVLTNCIIVCIVASSKLLHNVEEAPRLSPAAPSPVELVKAYGNLRVEYASARGRVSHWTGDVYDERSGKAESVLGGATESAPEEVDDEGAEVLRPVKLQPERSDKIGFSFPNSNGEASSDTLESTRKAITDGHTKPPRRCLKKSDTWDNGLRRHDENFPSLPPRMKKSETFGRQSDTAADSIPSLDQDELRRRADAFIREFKEELRLQERQDSLNRYQRDDSQDR